MTTTAASSRTLRVLLVEDNPADVALLQAVLAERSASVSLRVAPDGNAAIAAVEATQVDLILLDLNLPGKPGSEVLEELKADPARRRIPVIMLTTSSAEADVRHAYDHHANAFVTKPVDFDQFVRTVRAIEDFWFEQVRTATP